MNTIEQLIEEAYRKIDTAYFNNTDMSLKEAAYPALRALALAVKTATEKGEL